MKQGLAIALLVTFQLITISDPSYLTTCSKAQGDPVEGAFCVGDRNISLILSPTYTTNIDQPGTYTLTTDINFCPPENNTPVILISSKNVTLDLNGKYISKADGTEHNNIVGIKVADGLSNVTIESGSLLNLSGNGIEIGNNCSHITCKDLYVSGCNKSGIYLTGLNLCKIQNCHSVENALSGIHAFQCKHLTVTSCFLKANQGEDSDGAAAGILFDSCKFSSVKKCSSYENTNAQAVGITLLSSNDCTVNDCVSHSNTGTQSSTGFLVSNSLRNQFETCEASGNYSSSTTYGFHIKNSTDNTFVSCVASYNQSSKNTGSTSYGFFADSGNRNSITSCRSYSNLATGKKSDTNCSGIFLKSETNSTICKCLVQANTSDGTSDGVLLDDCNACIIRKNCSENNYGGLHAYGFRDTAASSKCWISENEAFANATENFQVKFRSAGSKLAIKSANVGKIYDLNTAKPYDNIEVMA